MVRLFSRFTHSIRLTNVSPSSSGTGAAPKLTQRKLDLRPPLSEKRKREITDKIAGYIALDMRPVNVMEGECFKELMRTLDHRSQKRDDYACGVSYSYGPLNY